MSKHTPGPWEVVIDGTMTGRGPHIVAQAVCADGYPREIADVDTNETRNPPSRFPKSRWKRSSDADEIDANANLIAAAPDLLVACKLQLLCIAGTPGARTASETVAIRVASDAIAKAEGGPQ